MGEPALIELKSGDCPVCGSSERVFVGKPRNYNQLFESLFTENIKECDIVRCRNCSLLYVYPLPLFSQRLLEKMYSTEFGYFPALAPDMEKILHCDNPNRRFDLIAKTLGRPVKNFLEIGCGQGYALKEALKRGWQVFGQDFSADFAGIVKEKTGLEIKVGQLTPEMFPKNTFDVVYIDSVIEHVPNPVEYLAMIRELLVSDGLVYLVVPNEDAFSNRLIDLLLKIRGSRKTSRLMPFTDSYHTIGFSKESIKMLASNTGCLIQGMACKNSYGHIDRFQTKRSVLGIMKQSATGTFHQIADFMDNGINLEVIFSQSNVGSLKR